MPDFEKEREALRPNARQNELLLRQEMKESKIDYRG